jgi:type I restriction enzyme M protein
MHLSRPGRRPRRADGGSVGASLHGIGAEDADSPITVDDSLKGDPGDRYDMVLTNPPFGKKSSMTVVNTEGETEHEDLVVVRDDFWASTSNKQLNFVQHVKTLLKIGGRAAIVVPDNVLFEGGAGETIRRNLLNLCDVHTLLRLPTGIFYANGVKANVLFFDKTGQRTGGRPGTRKLWVYDFRTDQRFTLKQRQLGRHHLDDFVTAYHSGGADITKRTPSERFRPYDYDELIARDKVNLDLTVLRSDIAATTKYASPDVIAQEIVDELEVALAEFTAVAQSLKKDAQPSADNK